MASLQIQTAVTIVERKIHVSDLFALTPETKQLVQDVEEIFQLTKIDDQVEKAARKGMMELIELFIQRGYKAFDFIMVNAAYGGHRNIVDRMLKLDNRDDTLNWTIAWASWGGQHDIIKLMMNLCRERQIKVDFDHAMVKASKGGHLDIVDEMIILGGRKFDWSLYAACLNGHHDVINRIINIWINQHITIDFNEAMAEAASNGHLDIVNIMIGLGANDLNRAMETAAKGGHWDIVRRMAELGRQHRIKINFSFIAAVARQNGFYALADWIHQHSSNPDLPIPNITIDA